MKKPTTNKQNTKTNTKSGSVKRGGDEARYTLVVDNKDEYQNEESIYYLHPSKLNLAKLLADKVFEEVQVRNTSVDALSGGNLNHILKKMKVDAPIEILIQQPIGVLQSYDAKQIEANAKLAGFKDIKTTTVEINKTPTLKVTATRPEKNPNSVEVEILIQQKKN